jgi:hypothetical protein
MPSDSADRFKPSACQADFTYTMTLDIIKIQDTGKGRKSVADDLKTVLRKIEGWHQGLIAGYRISYRDTQGLEHDAEWHRSLVRVR